ncbi:MAG: RICIN domain-containing protein [Hahellaceae bacterium]|nr:RICIN domain-containing protein [Hahellaceae bacterium]
MQDAAFNDGANVQQWSYGGGHNQQWELVSDNSGNYFIKNRNSGLNLDVAWGSNQNGANIQQANYNGSSAQKFRVVEMEKGIYRLENVASGVSQSPAANVHQWDYVSGGNQQWNLINTNNGYYKLQAKHSGQMLDIANGSLANAANVQQYPDNGSDAQLFALINAGNNEYIIRNKLSGKVLDIADWATHNGGNLIQYQNFGNANQKWRLVTTNGSGTTDGNNGGNQACAAPIWSDEFNYSGLPDPAKWSFEVQGPGWVNHEWQNYTGNRQENARVGNGVLTIEARRDWFGGHEISSARLKTHYKGDWLNGRIEVRAKLPRGRGTWPAIWMMPTDSTYGGWPNSGEIDIMENVGYDPAAIHGSIHTNGRNFMLRNNFQATTYDGSVMDSFHTYAIDWNQSRIVFYKDGQAFGTFANAGQGWTTWPFDKRFYLILNLDIGGDWGGAQGVDMNIFPAQMQVDWVRVYKPCN